MTTSSLPPQLPSVQYLELLSERFEHSKKPKNVHEIAEGLVGPDST